jgi:hypothetical protein
LMQSSNGLLCSISLIQDCNFRHHITYEFFLIILYSQTSVHKRLRSWTIQFTNKISKHKASQMTYYVFSYEHTSLQHRGAIRLEYQCRAVFIEEWFSGKYPESATAIGENVSCFVAFIHSNSLCLLLYFSVFCVFFINY